MGALVRNQIAAILIAVIWMLLVEALLVAFLPEIGKWLPGGAANAMAQASVPGGDLLPPLAGAALFLLYGVGLAVAGALTTGAT